ncbi:MAG TPA: acyltransferase family protein [Bacteroidales bacterium]|nr:acyltransferase family protein [Bacteroidales bacterium]
MTANTENTRQDYIDWLRVIAIFLLLLLHSAMPFFKWSDWHIHNAERSVILTHLVSFLHTWRMPLLFFISGFGTFYALKKRSARQYAGERTKRLFIPFIIGMFLIVPPQVFIEKIGQYGNYFNFLPEMFNGTYPQGNISWHHLWFILYLFLYSLMLIPFFFWYKSEKGNALKEKIYKLIARPGGVLLFVIPFFVVWYSLTPFFPNETHALFNDWRTFFYNLLFFVFGYMIMSDPRIKDVLVSQRRLLLYAVFLVFIPWYSNMFLPWESYSWIYYDAESMLLAWFIICALIGYGAKYLNRSNKFLKYANGALYPFYIVHQTVIVIIGYYILQQNWGIGLKYLVINVGTLVISLFLYEYIIRRTVVTRVIFGVKKPKLAESKTLVPEPVPVENK